MLYRGFGRAFAPELGAGRMERDALGETDDSVEKERSLKLRFSPARNFACSLLVQQRERDYQIGERTARNFGRRDRRRRWAVRGEVLVRRNLALTLAYERREGDSTRASRIFTAESVAAGLTLKLASASKQPSGAD